MKTLDLLRFLLLNLSVVFSAGLLFVNVYNSVVDAANWGSHLPNSVEAARAYFKAADPGTFFRIASPLSQVIALGALIACWNCGPTMRALCGLALTAAVASDVMTFAYFYPRNDVLFHRPLQGSMDAVRSAVTQWSAMNWVRSATVAVGVLMALASLTTFARTIGVDVRHVARQATA
ncbi:MAG: DUF1772 domain-containing protein [Armatimonadetes bacterium]|nr:DUF1772 domain-containing protein [Armatimonadota bacterium]